MPKKQKQKRKMRRLQRPRMSNQPRLRGRGGIKEIYNGVKDWSKGSGQPFMNMGRTLLDHFFPGAGGIAKSVMNFLGWGAYKGSKNTILEASPVPTIHAMPDRGVRIIHKEFLGTFSSSVLFERRQYSLNPGIQETFPWLSGVAGNFQKYKLNGLIFYTKSTAAEMVYSTNNALGTVIGVTQYNTYENNPTSINEALNISGAMEEKPSRDCIYPIECDRFHALFPTYFVRSGAVTDDLSKYDCGKFQLITEGSQAPAVVGQVWVAYDITLIQPIPFGLATTLYPVGSYMVPLAGDLTTSKWLVHTDTPVDNLYFLGGGTPACTDAAMTLPALHSPYDVYMTITYIVTSAGYAGLTVTPSNLTLVTASAGTAETFVEIFHKYSVIDPTLPASLTFSGGTAPTAPTLGGGSNALFTVVPTGGTTASLRVNATDHEWEEPESKETVPPNSSRNYFATNSTVRHNQDPSVAGPIVSVKRTK